MRLVRHCAAALAALLLCAGFARAQSAGEPASAAQVGDCAIFREGGSGYLLKTPTYWLRGTIAEVRSERRLAAHCPSFDKPPAAFAPADWARYAAALPCATAADAEREVEVLRVVLSVDAWETPWTRSHGASGWLFRGQFLDTRLAAGVLIDMDAAWLQRCSAGN
jgi:hypothetical protein